MFKVVRSMLAVVTASILAAPAAAQTGTADWRTVTAEEISKLFPGRTLHSINDRGQRYTIKFESTGRIFGDSTSLSGPTSINDDGTWKIKEQALCIQWRSWQQGKEICHGIEQESAGTKYRYTDSQRVFSLTQ